MPNSRPIMVGVNFSEESNAGLQLAARLASSRSAELHVIHIVDFDLIREMVRGLKEPEAKELESEILRAAEDRLREFVETAAINCEFVAHVIEGVPHDMLLQKSHELEPQLLVIGVEASGQGIALRVLRGARCPVLLARPDAPETFRSAVACVDFSAISGEELIQQSANLLTGDDPSVHAVHIVKEPWIYLYYNVPRLVRVLKKRGVYLEYLENKLKDLTRTIESPINKIECARYGIGASEGIVEYIEEVGADVVVLGSTGRSALGYILLGSTAEKLALDVPCSVLVLPTPKRAETEREQEIRENLEIFDKSVRPKKTPDSD